MRFTYFFCISLLLLVSASVLPSKIEAQTEGNSTTTVVVSICGNSLVDNNEECDVPGETGQYSTTIAGRQCSLICHWGPYCGDGILQLSYEEECDDGNNDNSDFCSATCKIEPAGSGGGGTSGGGSGGGGGSTKNLGDSEISITGLAYPNRTVNILLDGEQVGTVKTATTGRFDFSTKASPGTASLSFWAIDKFDIRSITFNTTFDVTQGAITNITGIILPPTIKLSNQNVNPGDVVTVSGQSIPNAVIEIYANKNEFLERATSTTDGTWSVLLDTKKMKVAEHTIKARSITGTPPITSQSSFSTALQLFVGVDGKVTTSSDLNRDTKVNLTDFSIMIFWWGSNGGNSNPSADINGNGKVGIEDFSILLFNWTG